MNFLQSVVQQIGFSQCKICVQISNCSWSLCWNYNKDKSLVNLLAREYVVPEHCQGMVFFEWNGSSIISQELESNFLWSDCIDYFIVLCIGPNQLQWWGYWKIIGSKIHFPSIISSYRDFRWLAQCQDMSLSFAVEVVTYYIVKYLFFQASIPFLASKLCYE